MTSFRLSRQEKLAVFCAGKSAGTTLSNLLYKELGSPECLREFQHLPFSVLGHYHRDRFEIYLRSLPKSRMDDVRVLVGHLPVDIGYSLPGMRFRYAMIIREPLARTVSSFFYIYQNALIRQDNDYLNALLHRHISKCDDIVYENPLCRNLTGSEALVPRDPEPRGRRPLPVMPADFELARNRLANFISVGVTERLEDSTRFLFDVLGREHPGPVPRDNITEVTLAIPDMHPDTLSLMRRMLAFDIELYGDAVEMFGQAAADYGLAPHDYQKPEAQPGFISSGDYSHLTSAASAFGDCSDAVWMSAPDMQANEWLGFDFGEETMCTSVCVQMPNGTGEEVLLQLEASSDDFRDEILAIDRLLVRCDGCNHLFVLTAEVSRRAWRVKGLQKAGEGPLAIAYLKFNATDADSPRDLAAVRRSMDRAEALFHPR